jgi:hypothetical protein
VSGRCGPQLRISASYIVDGGVICSAEEFRRQVSAFLDLRGAGACAVVGLRGRPGLSGRPLWQRTGAGLPSRRCVPSYRVVRRRPSVGGLLYSAILLPEIGIRLSITYYAIIVLVCQAPNAIFVAVWRTWILRLAAKRGRWLHCSAIA